MARSVMRLLLLQIEVAEHAGNEREMFECYNRAKGIPKLTLTPRQQGMLTHIEGLRLLIEEKVGEARQQFWEAFCLFNQAGTDRRLHSLKYCALCAICAKETVSVFLSPEASPFQAHPVTAPIAQLADAFLRPSIAAFTKGLDSVLKSFGNDSRIARMLEDVRVWVLAKEVKVYVAMFKKVSVSYAAKELGTDENELSRTIMELIEDDELEAYIDDETGHVVTEFEEDSPYSRGLEELLDGLEAVVGTLDGKSVASGQGEDDDED
jgi:hypothetical protein